MIKEAGATRAEKIIKVIAIIYFIIAALTIFFSIAVIILLFLFSALFSGLSQAPSAWAGIPNILVGSLKIIVYLAYVVFMIFVVKSLLKHKSWARIATIVISGLAVVSGLLLLPSINISLLPFILPFILLGSSAILKRQVIYLLMIIHIIVHIIIFIFITFNERVIKVFKRPKSQVPAPKPPAMKKKK